MANILDHLKQYKFLSLEDMRLLAGIGKLKTYKKGQLISSAGQVNYKTVIVVKGLIRAYTNTSNGEEITLAFATAGMELASPPSVFKDLPSIDTIEAIENSIVFEADTRKFEALAKKHLRISQFHNKLLKKTLLIATERIEFYLTLNPEERFQHIQKNKPDLIQRVPQKYLASYIGITEVSLSRLKARVGSKKQDGGN